MSAQITAVVGEKGGTGKSTLATNLAAMLSMQGKDVLLVDTDTQHTAYNWAAVRGENKSLPPVRCVVLSGKPLPTQVKDLASRYEAIVIDAGGRDSVELRGALLVAQVAILPFQPAQFDLWTVEKMYALQETVSVFNPALRVKAVFNQAEPSYNNTRAEALDAKAFLSEFPSIELLPTAIKKRLSYKRASAEGMSLLEYESDWKSKAADELRALFYGAFGSKFPSERSQCAGRVSSMEPQ